jgi:rod shape-determining protein MreC
MPPYEPDPMESGRGRELWLSVFFMVLSAVLLALPSGMQESVGAGLRGSVLRPFIAVQESVSRTRMRAREVTELQERLDAAVAVLSAQRTLADENTRLRDLLGLRERAVPGFVSASVIRAGTRGSQSMFLLDAGSADGVRVNDPVVAAGGLIGVVREVGPGTAVAMDWTHPDFRVSAMTVTGEASGMVQPYAGDFREEDRLILVGIPYYTTLSEGTAVVTSGRGSVYPRGILVGTIGELARTDAGWSRGYWLIPAVRPAEADHVLIITGDRGTPAGDLLDLWVEPDSVVEPDPAIDPDPETEPDSVVEPDPLVEPDPGPAPADDPRGER